MPTYRRTVGKGEEGEYNFREVWDYEERHGKKPEELARMNDESLDSWLSNALKSGVLNKSMSMVDHYYTPVALMSRYLDKDNKDKELKARIAHSIDRVVGKLCESEKLKEGKDENALYHASHVLRVYGPGESVRHLVALEKSRGAMGGHKGLLTPRVESAALWAMSNMYDTPHFSPDWKKTIQTINPKHWRRILYNLPKTDLLAAIEVLPIVIESAMNDPKKCSQDDLGSILFEYVDWALEHFKQGTLRTFLKSLSPEQLSLCKASLKGHAFESDLRAVGLD